MEKTLTVVVPSYNQGRFIAENLGAYRTVAGDVELLVFDGGSTDETLAVLEAHADIIHYSRSGPDGGQAAAINSGLQMATGEWVCFQNSDDYHIPGELPSLIKFLKDARADVVLGGFGISDAVGNINLRSIAKPIWFSCLSSRNFVHNQCTFIRRPLLDRAGFLDPSLKFCLDYDWFVRILRTNPTIALYPRIVGVQRFHEDTKTANMQLVHDTEFARLRALHFSPWQRFMGSLLLYPYKAFRYIYALAR